MEIIDNKIDLHNYLFENYPGSIDEIKDKIDAQCNCAMENSDYPAKDTYYLCCRDIWELIEDEFLSKQDVTINLPYNDCVDVIGSM